MHQSQHRQRPGRRPRRRPASARSRQLAPAIGYSLLAGASIGALSTLQGIYTNELVGAANLSLLMGAQQAVFAIGGALGPVIAGGVSLADNSYTPVVLLAATAS